MIRSRVRHWAKRRNDRALLCGKQGWIAAKNSRSVVNESFGMLFRGRGYRQRPCAGVAQAWAPASSFTLGSAAIFRTPLLHRAPPAMLLRWWKQRHCRARIGIESGHQAKTSRVKKGELFIEVQAISGDAKTICVSNTREPFRGPAGFLRG